jgi:hypothetical protein
MGGVIWFRPKVFEESGMGMERKTNLKELK